MNYKVKIPQSVELERIILGNLLLDRKVSDILYKLNIDDFYKDLHKKIFEKILFFYAKNNKIDYVLIANEFDEEFDYVIELIDVPDVYDYHIEELLNLSGKRKIQKVAEELVFDINKLKQNEILEKIASMTIEPENELHSIEEVIEEFDELFKKGNAKERLPLYSHNLWYDRNELIIVAARPSVGKSLFAVDMASRLLKKGKTVLYFSFEMSRTSLFERLIKNRTSIVKLNDMTKDEFIIFKEEKERLRTQNLLFFDNGILDIFDLINIVKSKNKVQKIDFVIVDHLGLIHSKQKSRIDQVSEISRNLKLLAMQENIPVMALSQLNRAIEHRTNKQPVLADLRDSGSIEQDADKILFLYRETEADKEKSIEDIIIDVAKYRDGCLERRKVTFNKAMSRVFDLD